MKKLLLLGGSAQQVVAIKTAKRLGFYTVLCDFLPDNPGRCEADKFYPVSTTDIEKVLEVATKEKIDGVIAYASDPAAPTAAYVAEKLNLSGNPYNSVCILCNKDKFREFLRTNGFSCPSEQHFSNTVEAKQLVSRDKFPVIVKPVDSSGSKGVTICRSPEEIDKAIDFAFSYSRSDRIVVEDYIEMAHRYLIGGDVFVSEGKIVLFGLLNCHRDKKVNPLVPVGKSYPLDISENDREKVKNVLQDMVTKLGIKNGEMNVELMIDKNGNIYPVDIGPRAGGNMIPDLLGMIYNVDLVEASIKTAMGQTVFVNETVSECYYATHNLHTDKNALFDRVEFSEKACKYSLKKYIYKKSGDSVEFFDNSAKALGIVFFRFPDENTMDEFLVNIDEHIKVITR